MIFFIPIYQGKQYQLTALKPIPTPRYSHYLTHAHNHITCEVEAMDSCFALVRAHQHGIAVGSMNGVQLIGIMEVKSVIRNLVEYLFHLLLLLSMFVYTVIFFVG